MSTELAQSEEDAEDYDLEALERREHAKDVVNGEADAEGQIRLGGDSRPLREDNLVFEIGDEGSDKEDDDHAGLDGDEMSGLMRSGGVGGAGSRRMKDRVD